MSKEKEMPGFVWLHEWSDNAENFDDAQLASFCRAMFAAARGKKYTLPEDPLALLAFKYANRDRERMDAFKKKQTKNGEGGGAPLGNKNASKQPKNNPKTTEEQPKNNPKTTQKQPKNNPKQAQGQRQGQRQGQSQEQSQGQKQIQNNPDEDDDNAHASGQSVVVGLLDFLNNIYGDFNFTPSQVQLVMSKPADYWESFMDEVQASKWLKTKDPALALRLHEKVVAGEYHTYPEKTKPEPTIPQPIQHQPTKEELYVKQLVEEWETLVNTDPVGANYPKLNELKLKHGQLPSAFLEEIGMQYYAGGWHFKY